MRKVSLLGAYNEIRADVCVSQRKDRSPLPLTLSEFAHPSRNSLCPCTAQNVTHLERIAWNTAHDTAMWPISVERTTKPRPRKDKVLLRIAVTVVALTSGVVFLR